MIKKISICIIFIVSCSLIYSNETEKQNEEITQKIKIIDLKIKGLSFSQGYKIYPMDSSQKTLYGFFNAKMVNKEEPKSAENIDITDKTTITFSSTPDTPLMYNMLDKYNKIIISYFIISFSAAAFLSLIGIGAGILAYTHKQYDLDDDNRNSPLIGGIASIIAGSLFFIMLFSGILFMVAMKKKLKEIKREFLKILNNESTLSIHNKNLKFSFDIRLKNLTQNY
jgi:hypothetical protein